MCGLSSSCHLVMCACSQLAQQWSVSIAALWDISIQFSIYFLIVCVLYSCLCFIVYPNIAIIAV